MWIYGSQKLTLIINTHKDFSSLLLTLCFLIIHTYLLHTNCNILDSLLIIHTYIHKQKRKHVNCQEHVFVYNLVQKELDDDNNYKKQAFEVDGLEK